MEKTKSQFNIAIDGPAGVGKTTIGLALAETLDARFVDTGIMYRGIAYLAIQNNILPIQLAKIIQLATETVFTLNSDDQGIESQLMINGSLFADMLHTETVNSIVSDIAMIPEVRIPLVAWQRSIASSKRTIMVGRDITTAVLPKAELKVYLDASLEERNRRRNLQDNSQSHRMITSSTTIASRDEIDSTRTASPLYIGSSVTRIDTTNLTFNQVYEIILNTAKAKIL
jgi:cytidylate kinase